MFSHIMIGARDLETMVVFYDAILTPLQLQRVVELEGINETGVIWRRGYGVGLSSPSGTRSMGCRQHGARACKFVS
ncbi:hypothetical protein SAMN03159406_04255 [Rhizobium sp. NFR03]|nr:hypothetical protein SAMN03159406_04255 [Rhizobium sp. NFR03]